MKDMCNIKRIVIKVGSSTITRQDGLNLRKLDQLAMVLSDIKNKGIDIVLVSSGAVSAGANKLKMQKRPSLMKEKQAAASVGQCELMFIYDKLFSQYGQMISQLLITKTVTSNDTLRINAMNTLETLLQYGVIPIINENDSVAVDEIAYGDNDTLSAVSAYLVHADLLILLSDIDGLYDKNPNVYADAKLIDIVHKLDDKIMAMAGDSSNDMGTGGMFTKLHAAAFAAQYDIPMIIANGDRPSILYDILEDTYRGTLFDIKEKANGINNIV